MTPEDVKRMADEITGGDPEVSHSDLDLLWENVLLAIATGIAEDPKGCAREAVRALEKVPARWYRMTLQNGGEER